jgi:hypothetical protein
MAFPQITAEAASVLRKPAAIKAESLKYIIPV